MENRQNGHESNKLAVFLANAIVWMQFSFMINASVTIIFFIFKLIKLKEHLAALHEKTRAL